MSAERTRAFVDSNVLVYAHDEGSGEKFDRAQALVRRLWDDRTACVSVQVLQELFVTLTRKLPTPVDPAEARAAVEDFARWTVHRPGPVDVLAAIDISERARISFWDAMIVQSSIALGCDVLYSEDLNAGQRYDGVVVVDPFAG